MSLLKLKGLEQSREKGIDTKLKQEFVPGSLKSCYFKVCLDSFLNIFLLDTFNFTILFNVEHCTHI